MDYHRCSKQHIGHIRIGSRPPAKKQVKIKREYWKIFIPGLPSAVRVYDKTEVHRIVRNHPSAHIELVKP